MDVSNGRIMTIDDMAQSKKLAKELISESFENKSFNLGVVPVADGKEDKMRGWGKKKRNRYQQLLQRGIPETEAFDCVENLRGVIP